ncbi:MAG: AbiV family abortive infection protein, partial [Sediminibacterium sp.]
MDNTDFYIDGFKLTLENSLSLKKIADLSFAEGEYGIACSLNILAAEEAVKANFILIKHYNPNTEINDFKEVFRKHTVKHDHLKGIAAVHEVQLKRFKTDLEVFDKFLGIIDQIPDEIKQKTLADFSPWFKVKDLVKRFEERKVTYDEIALWADKANNDKNNGFYVDIRSGGWATPKSFIKEKYTLESKYTDAILDYVRDTEKV